MKPLLLASESLLRQKILTDLNIPFTAKASGLDETLCKTDKPEELPELLAAKKAEAAAARYDATQAYSFVLAADTIILYNGTIYGKPANREQAAHFLHTLQGKTHTVITAIALYNLEKRTLSKRVSTNKVTFAPLTSQEVEAYLNTEEWRSAAGAYRIQGMASCFISRLEGSYSSVAGLPIFELYDILKEQNYSVLN